jgi:hypothetical protein
MFSRRSLLKALAAGPVFSLVSYGSRIFSLPTQTGASVPEYSHILLHGLIFLEYQDDHLVITVPDVSQHSYEIGIPDSDHDRKEAPAKPSNLLDWTSSLRGGAIKTFPREIGQFSKSTTGVGDLTTNFRFKLVLPLPIEVIPLRLGRLADFPARATGNVWKSMQKQCGPDLALVTCLRYTGKVDPNWSKTNRCHFYAEPKKCLALEHMNEAFRACQQAFQNPSAFDLQIDPHTDVPPTKPQDPGQPGYLSQSDELCLAELAKDDSCKGPNVANCGQFGINP